uniref:Uncharacterized protein n=1 Tax=Latimeria chalumnae TaxID=7897 RepID=H3AZR1_LATCH
MCRVAVVFYFGARNYILTPVSGFVHSILEQRRRHAFYSRRSLQTTGTPAKEQHALRSYCSAKIRLIEQRAKAGQPDRCRRQRQTLGALSRETGPSDANCAVPDCLWNRIQLKMITEAVRQALGAEMHEPSRCPACLQKKAELMKRNFIKLKKAQVEAAVLREKIEEQIYTRDPITLIGEIQRDLPRPSDSPSEIWRRLAERRKTA